jgi:truncated hemoglobin YjbI
MERSLYKRLGGVDSIIAVVDDFRDRVGNDDRINQKFARTDMARLRRMLSIRSVRRPGDPSPTPGAA